MASEGWRKVKVTEKQKLFRIKTFLFVSQGRSYNIEVQEDSEGNYLAHAENTSDPHDAIKSVSGKSLEESLEAMIQQIEVRESNS